MNPFKYPDMAPFQFISKRFINMQKQSPITLFIMLDKGWHIKTICSVHLYKYKDAFLVRQGTP